MKPLTMKCPVCGDSMELVYPDDFELGKVVERVAMCPACTEAQRTLILKQRALKAKDGVIPLETKRIWP